MNGPGALALSILMIAAFLMFGGGIWLIAKKRDFRRGMLMLVAAIVFLGNAMIWTL